MVVPLPFALLVRQARDSERQQYREKGYRNKWKDPRWNF